MVDTLKVFSLESVALFFDPKTPEVKKAEAWCPNDLGSGDEDGKDDCEKKHSTVGQGQTRLLWRNHQKEGEESRGMPCQSTTRRL